MVLVMIGAGGIGGYYGARLQDGGERVTFVARGAHLDALQVRGLRVCHSEWRFDAPASALSLDRFLQDTSPAEVDLIIALRQSDADGFHCP